MGRVYVASSWKNQDYPAIVEALAGLREGLDVYDFRVDGFAWADVDPRWEQWTHEDYLRGLTHPLADTGFARDYREMVKADYCVLVLPCGRSAHLEAGWFAGREGKRLYVLLDRKEVVPELMYKMADLVTVDLAEIAEEIVAEEEDREQEAKARDAEAI